MTRPWAQLYPTCFFKKKNCTQPVDEWVGLD